MLVTFTVPLGNVSQKPIPLGVRGKGLVASAWWALGVTPNQPKSWLRKAGMRHLQVEDTLSIAECLELG